MGSRGQRITVVGMITAVTAVSLVGALGVYKQILSPLLPRACRFVPTCSEYARQALACHGLGRGLVMAVARLCRCHPFHSGGWDPPH